MMTRRCWSRWSRFPHFPFQIWISDERAGSAARTRTPSPSSVTRLGNFLKFWVKIFVTKVAQMYSDFWTILKTSFQLKQRLQTFWASFFIKKLGYFLFQHLVTLSPSSLTSIEPWMGERPRCCLYVKVISFKKIFCVRAFQERSYKLFHKLFGI